MPEHDQDAGRFDIRAWMRRHNVTLPIKDPAVRKEISTLFRRDLTPEWIAAYAESHRRNQDQTVHGNADAQGYGDSVSA
jgi:hypothetical protein